MVGPCVKRATSCAGENVNNAGARAASRRSDVANDAVRLNATNNRDNYVKACSPLRRADTNKSNAVWEYFADIRAVISLQVLDCAIRRFVRFQTANVL